MMPDKRAAWLKFKKLIFRILQWLYQKRGRELPDESFDFWMEMIKFGLVSLSSTAVNYAVNVTTLILLSRQNLSWDYIAANLAGFFISVLYSYYFNSKYVFKVGKGETRSSIRALLRTYVSYGFTGIILNNALSLLWVGIFHMSKYVAPILNLFLGAPINYLMTKMWAFKSSKAK